MKILFLITSSLDYPFGQGRCTPLAQGLADLGHQVSIAALHPALESVSVRSFRERGVQVDYVGPMHVKQVGHERQYYGPLGLGWAVFRGSLGLILPALLSDADILHVGKPQPMNGLAGLLGKWLRGRQLYVDCDDYEAESNRYDGDWQKRIVAFWEDHLPHFARGVTVNTRFMQRRLEAMGYPSDHIAYVPNGINDEWLQMPSPAQLDALRQQWGLEGKEIVAYVGSMSLVSHRIDLLLQAFSHLLDTRPTAVLLLVGGGEDYQTLQRMAAHMGIEASVRFTGHLPISDIPAYYRLAKVTVDPVYDDPVARARCPLKIVESLALGTPVVTGDVGDRREMLDNGQAGLLVSPGQAGALAAGLAQILENPGLANALSERALVHREKFYWNRLVQRVVELYQICQE